MSQPKNETAVLVLALFLILGLVGAGICWFSQLSGGKNTTRSVKQASDRGVQVLMLATNTSELDQALQVVQVNNKRLKILAGDDVYTPKTLEVGRQADQVW